MSSTLFVHCILALYNLPTVCGLANGAIYLNKGVSNFDKYVEPLLYDAQYSHAAIVIDRSIVELVDPSYLRPSENWYLLTSEGPNGHNGVVITPYAQKRRTVISEFIRESSSIDQTKLVEAARNMMGGDYDFFAGLPLAMKDRSKPDSSIVNLLRQNRYTCSSSVAYVLTYMGCADFPNWRNVVPTDFDIGGVFGEIGCGYGPLIQL